MHGCDADHPGDIIESSDLVRQSGTGTVADARPNLHSYPIAAAHALAGRGCSFAYGLSTVRYALLPARGFAHGMPHTAVAVRFG